MKRRIVTVLFVFSLITLLSAQEKPDALKFYRNGRDLEAAGRTDDAKAAYAQAIEICKTDLLANARNMDAYSIYGWSLIRLGKYQDTVKISLDALRLAQDFRVVETLGEAYFYLGNFRECLKQMERYADSLPRGERISTVYFFIGEVYRIQKQYNRADIAYSQAVYHEPALSLWWFRLGTVRESVGDKAGARLAYERALRLRPDYRDANEGLSRVRS